METYRQHINEIVLAELQAAAEQHEIIFVEKLCQHIADTYNLDIGVVRVRVKWLYPTLSLTKRRLNKALKQFYGLQDIAGFPNILCR